MLKLYRRHNAECRAGLQAKGLKGPKLNAYKGCSCAIQFRGTWAGKTYLRQSLDVTDWKIAEKLVQEMMTSPKDKNATRTLQSALEDWYTQGEQARRAESTVGHRKRYGAQLLEAAGDGAMLVEVDFKTIITVRAKWGKLADSTHRTNLQYLSGFFHFAVSEGWINRSPLPHVRDWPPAPTGEDREETLPIDPDGGETNYHKIMAQLAEPRAQLKGRKPIVLGPALIAITELMYEAGLRISDAVKFRPAKMVFHSTAAQYTFLPIKTARKRRLCTTFLPLELAHRLKALPQLSPGHPFWDGKSNPVVVAHAIRTELARAGNACGVPDVRPHRFRDSFAVNHLLRGTDIKTLSGYLGHKSVATTEQYYSPWTKSRVDHSLAAYVKARPQNATPSNVLQMPRASGE